MVELRQLFQFVLPHVDVSFNRELFNTRSTTSRLHFGEKKLCRSIRDQDGGGEGGGRVISISGGKQGYSAWHGYIVFRFAAVPSIFDARTNGIGERFMTRTDPSLMFLAATSLHRLA